MNKRKQWEKLRLKRLLIKKDDKTIDEEIKQPEKKLPKHQKKSQPNQMKKKKQSNKRTDQGVFMNFPISLFKNQKEGK